MKPWMAHPWPLIDMGQMIVLSQLNNHNCFINLAIYQALMSCNFSRTRWYIFGLSLGLPKTRLDVIECDRQSVTSCLHEVIYLWVSEERKYFAFEIGPPNWDSLQTALLSIDEYSVANSIDKLSKYNM